MAIDKDYPEIRDTSSTACAPHLQYCTIQVAWVPISQDARGGIELQGEATGLTMNEYPRPADWGQAWCSVGQWGTSNATGRLEVAGRLADVTPHTTHHSRVGGGSCESHARDLGNVGLAYAARNVTEGPAEADSGYFSDSHQ